MQQRSEKEVGESTNDIVDVGTSLPPEFPVHASGVLLGEKSVAPVVDGEVVEVLLQLIGEAQSEICLLAFEFVEGEATTKIEEALGAAARRGVDVKVLVDTTVESSLDFVQRMVGEGVSAKLDTVGKAHTKMMVADGSYAVVGSTNLSTSSLRYNHEVNLLFSTPETLSAAHDYCIARHGTPSSWENAVSSPEADPRLFGDGRGVEALTSAVQAAQERIDVVIYAVNADPKYPDGPVMQFIGELGQAVERGVSVFVLLERSDYNEGLNDLNDAAAIHLRSLGVLVRHDEADVITHAKLLLADGVAVVSTGNWSYSGLSTNHELTLRTADPDTVAILRSYAQERYTRGE